MVKTLAPWLAPAALCAATLAAQAQTSPPAGRPDPLDAQASVPALVYRSSLTPVSAKDDAAIAWREANDTVTRIGGWRAYAREANEPAAAPPPRTPAASASAPQGKDIGKPMPMTHGPGGHSGHRTP